MLRDTVSSGEEVEGQVIGRIMEQEIKTGLWKIVKECTTEEENRIIGSRFKKGLSLEETGNQLGIDLGKTKTMESMALRKLRSSRVSRKIIENR